MDKMKLTINDIGVVDGKVYLLDKLNQKKIEVVLVATELIDKLYDDANKLMSIQTILNKNKDGDE